MSMLYPTKRNQATSSNSNSTSDGEATPIVESIDTVDFIESNVDKAGLDTSANSPKGLFVDTRPSANTKIEAPKRSLKELFGAKKPTIAAETPSAEVGPTVMPEKPKFNWPKFGTAKSKKSPTTAEAAVARVAEVEEPATVRPTEHVASPILVRKVSDKKHKIGQLPIRVFIGYLPEVTEKDAREYAMGIAVRNCEHISIAYYDAFKYKDGYAYEVHEGGDGRAFLPEILKYFEAQGSFEKGNANTCVFIKTATRTVQVEQSRDGLQAFLLPESSTEEPSDWLTGTTKMTPGVQTMTGLLVFGAVLFTTGFLALALSFVSRIQPYDAPMPPEVEKTKEAYNVSPMSRWTTLQGVSSREYVKALKYSKGKWEIEREITPLQVETPAAKQKSETSTDLPTH